MGACTWHIMVIDFPKNLGHLPDYESVKAFVYSNLVYNTVDKHEWEEYLLQACRTWQKAAPYLNELALTKHRWAAPWRKEHFTAGYKSSSPVEGSFSAFQNGLGGSPESFVGVVQTSVRKDVEKLREEQLSIVKQQMVKLQQSIFDDENDSHKQCAAVFSLHITEKLKNRNSQSLNYDCLSLDPISEMYQEMGATNVYEVKRRSSQQSKPRIVWEIDGVLYCSCLSDINEGCPCSHIQCVRRGAFCDKQFSDHWRICDSVDVAPVVEHLKSTEDGNEFGDLDGHGNVDGTIDNGAIDGGAKTDGVGVFVEEYAAINGSAQQVDTMEKVPATAKSVVSQTYKKVAKKKKLNSTAKYNLVLQESKHLATIVSAENEEKFEKAMVVLKFLRSNIQHKSATAIIAASADYLGVSQPNMASTDGLDSQTVHAPLLQRTEGASSTKRKRNCVEKAVTKTRARSCKWCHNIGHTITNCPSGKSIGKRVTVGSWEAEMGSVARVSANNMPQHFDPMVPKDAIGLQITGCRPTGLRSGDGLNNNVYRAQVVLKGCVLKVGPFLWLERETINAWANCGKSGSHYVFVKKN